MRKALEPNIASAPADAKRITKRRAPKINAFRRLKGEVRSVEKSWPQHDADGDDAGQRDRIQGDADDQGRLRDEGDHDDGVAEGHPGVDKQDSADGEVSEVGLGGRLRGHLGDDRGRVDEAPRRNRSQPYPCPRGV